MGNMERGMYAHRCREFKLNCRRTGDSLSFIGSSVAWGELVGEWPEGNVPSSESFFWPGVYFEVGALSSHLCSDSL